MAVESKIARFSRVLQGRLGKFEGVSLDVPAPVVRESTVSVDGHDVTVNFHRVEYSGRDTTYLRTLVVNRTSQERTMDLELVVNNHEGEDSSVTLLMGEKKSVRREEGISAIREAQAINKLLKSNSPKA